MQWYKEKISKNSTSRCRNIMKFKHECLRFSKLSEWLDYSFILPYGGKVYDLKMSLKFISENTHALTSKFKIFNLHEVLHRWLSGKESACQAGDMGLIPGSGRSPKKEMTNRSSVLAWKNPMDWGAWQPTVHQAAKECNTTEWLSKAWEVYMR